MRKRIWPKKKRIEPEIVGPPQYLKDITWMDGAEKPPSRFKGGMTKRDLAQWLGRIDFCKEIVDVMFQRKEWSYEMWRALFIHQMAFEFSVVCPQKGVARPDWMDLEAYRKVRWRTEAERGGEVLTTLSFKIEQSKQRAKRPTKRDMLDAKYRDLLKGLE